MPAIYQRQGPQHNAAQALYLVGRLDAQGHKGFLAFLHPAGVVQPRDDIKRHFSPFDNFAILAAGGAVAGVAGSTRPGCGGPD
jgi:hypothetical protein